MGNNKPSATPYDRFVTKYKVVESGCWEWTAYLMELPSGGQYGQFYAGRINGKKTIVLAHRWSYEYHFGIIPDGLHIDHLCRNTKCVNPDHLEAVTQAINNKRQGSAVTQCPQGHEYSEQNTYYHPNGSRVCKTCKRVRDAEARKTRREKQYG